MTTIKINSLYSSVVQSEAHRWHNIKVKINSLHSSVVQPEAHRWHNIKVKIDSLYSSVVQPEASAPAWYNNYMSIYGLMGITFLNQVGLESPKLFQTFFLCQWHLVLKLQH
jgi:hypothetical protein